MRVVFFRWKSKLVAVISAVALLGIMTASPKSVFAATITWDNGGGDGLWSTCTNWSGDVCPGSGDIATFDPAVSDTPSTLDASFGGFIGGVNIVSGFTSTITQQHFLVVGTSGWTQNGGVFAGGTDFFSTSHGTFTLNSGTFTAPNGTSFELDTSAFVMTGGTFNPNDGIFTADGTGSSADVNTSLTLSSFRVAMSAGNRHFTIAAGDTLVVTGNTFLSKGKLDGGTVEAQGEVSTGSWPSYLNGGTGTLLIDGPAVRTVSLSDVTYSGSNLPNVVLNSPNVTIEAYGVPQMSSLTVQDGFVTAIPGDVWLYLNGNYTQTGGTVDLTQASSYLNVDGVFSVTGDTASITLSGQTLANGGWTHTGLSTINVGTGFVKMIPKSDIAISGLATFNDLLIDVCSSAMINRTVTVGGGPGNLFEVDGVARIHGCGFSNMILLRSDVPGTPADVNFAGPATLSRLAVTDINNTGPTQQCVTKCMDRGGNAGLSFLPDNRFISVSAPYSYSGNDTIDTSEDGNAVKIDVVLKIEPTADVTIPVSTSNSAEAVTDVSSLTFTTFDWNIPQTVAVIGQDDAVDDDAVNYSVNIGAATSIDLGYDGMEVDVPLKNLDNDTAPGKVDLQRTADLNVSLVDISSDGSKLAFTNWTDGLFNANYALDTTHDNVAYDSNTDTFWEADGGNNQILQFNKLTGAILNTVPIATPSSPSRIVYDSFDQSLWVTFTGNNSVVKLNAADGTPFDTDLPTSTYNVGGSPNAIAYDVNNNLIWIETDNPDLAKVDATTGTLLAQYPIASSGASVGNDMIYDSVDNTVWVLHHGVDYYWSVDSYNPATGALLAKYPLPAVSGNINGDLQIVYDVGGDIVWISDAPYDESDGSVWDSADFLIALNGGDGSVRQISDADFLSLGYPAINSSESVVAYGGHTFARADGLTTGTLAAKIESVSNGGDMWGHGELYYHTLYWPDEYMAATTQSNGMINTNTWGTSTEYPSNEITNTANYYTFSFDGGLSYYIWTGSVWRVIASSLASDHGVPADDGLWYYRDGADGWTPDPGGYDSSAIGNAIKYAGGVNDMLGSAVQGITNPEWESAPGWTATTLLASSSYYTRDTTIDTTGWTAVTGATVNEALEGQDAFYAFSFAAGDYSVWTGSAWRVIASSNSAVTGGVDGDWFFRDGADGWTSTFDQVGANDAVHSLSLAVSGISLLGVPENEMTGTTVNGLAQADLMAAGGWTVTSPIDVGVILHTADRTATASVEDVSFSYAAVATPGVTITQTGGTTNVTEGGATDTYSVVLNTLPTDDVIVTATGNADVNVGGPLTFTTLNWDTPQTITVTAVDDSIDEVSPENATITHAATSVGDTDYDGISISNVTAHVTDNDVAGISVGSISGHTTEAGGTASFTVVLDTQPTANVTIGVTSDDLTEGTVSAPSLTFTSSDWFTAQTVTLTGIDDLAVDGNITYHAVLAAATSADTFYSGMNPADVTVINDDNDVAPPSGGSGSGSTFVQLPADASVGEQSVTSQSCTTVSLVNVRMSARNATQYMLSIDGNFDSESWLSFVPNVSNGAIAIPTMNLGVLLPETDGTYNIYVRYKSSTGNVSPIVTTQVVRDAAGACTSPVVTPPPEVPPVDNNPNPTLPPGAVLADYQPGCLNILRPKDLVRKIVGRGLSPVTQQEEDILEPLPGDYIRAQHIDTVYCIDASGRRRPFIDETTYFTFERSFAPVIFVSDATLTTIDIGPPMLPKAGVTLIKFRSDSTVYRVLDNPTDPDRRIIRPLVSEEVAKANYGSNWGDYVIDVDESLSKWFIHGDPITGVEREGLSTLRPRSLLNEVSKSIEQQVSDFGTFIGSLWHNIF